MAFIALTDVEFIYAEGLNMSEDVKRQSLRWAQAEITAQLETLAAPAAA